MFPYDCNNRGCFSGCFVCCDSRGGCSVSRVIYSGRRVIICAGNLIHPFKFQNRTLDNRHERYLRTKKRKHPNRSNSLGIDRKSILCRYPWNYEFVIVIQNSCSLISSVSTPFWNESLHGLIWNKAEFCLFLGKCVWSHKNLSMMNDPWQRGSSFESWNTKTISDRLAIRWNPVYYRELIWRLYPSSHIDRYLHARRGPRPLVVFRSAVFVSFAEISQCCTKIVVGNVSFAESQRCTFVSFVESQWCNQYWPCVMVIYHYTRPHQCTDYCCMFRSLNPRGRQLRESRKCNFVMILIFVVQSIGIISGGSPKAILFPCFRNNRFVPKSRLISRSQFPLFAVPLPARFLPVQLRFPLLQSVDGCHGKSTLICKCPDANSARSRISIQPRTTRYYVKLPNTFCPQCLTLSTTSLFQTTT